MCYYFLFTAVDFIPVVGNIKSGVEAITGYDPITGRKLEPWERAVSTVGILGGPAAKAVKHGGKLAVKGGKFLQQQGSKLVQQGGKLLEKGGNLLGKAADGLNLSGPKLATAGAGLGKFSLSTGISAGKKTTGGSKQVGNLTSSSSGKDKGNGAAKGTGKGNKLELEDFTKEILKTKPMNSPIPEKWYKKGGSISIDDNGTWTYTNKSGISVSYPNGYPDFTSYMHPNVKPVKIEVHSPKNNPKDFENANKAAGLSKDTDPPIIDYRRPPEGYTGLTPDF